MILHGKDLIVSIDGNANMASKSCTLNVSAKSMVKTSPTSGDWEEVLSGKKSWNLTTNHLVKKDEESGGNSEDPRFTSANYYFKNSKTDGWEARGYGNISGRGSLFDEFDDAYNITVLEITDYGYVKDAIHFNKDGRSVEQIGGNYVTLYQYLNGDVSGHVPDEYNVIAILTIGEFSIDAATCNLLSDVYHVALPCVEFGRRPASGSVSYETAPIIIAGGKHLNYGFTSLDSISNEILFGTTGGQVYTPEQGIPTDINMVGKKVAIRMTDNNGNVWAGEAIVTQFKVTGTKGNLMAGSFSFKGNSELQTESRLDYEPTPVPEYVNRIVLDMKESNPVNMIKGDINGTIFQEIMAGTHRYLCKYAALYPNNGMWMCQLNDSNSNFFHDGTQATLDGTQGDVYVRFGSVYDPQTGEDRLYYKINDLGNKRYELAVSKEYIYGFSIYYPGNNLIAAFKAVGTQSYNDNVGVAAGGSYYLRSIVANRPGIKDTPFNIAAALGRMNAEKFDFINYQEHALVAMLYFIKYGNPNCKAICGNGASEETNSGVTAWMGMTDTYSPIGADTINLFGLENWWGGGTEVLSSMTYGQGNIYITKPDDTRITVPVSSADGATNPVIQNMFMQADPLVMVPQGKQPYNLDYTKYFCNAVSFGQYGLVLRGKGGEDGGITWLGLGTMDNISARLCYRGKTTVVEDPQEFLALKAVDPAK